MKILFSSTSQARKEVGCGEEFSLLQRIYLLLLVTMLAVIFLRANIMNHSHHISSFSPLYFHVLCNLCLSFLTILLPASRSAGDTFWVSLGVRSISIVLTYFILIQRLCFIFYDFIYNSFSIDVRMQITQDTNKCANWSKVDIFDVAFVCML